MRNPICIHVRSVLLFIEKRSRHNNGRLNNRLSDTLLVAFCDTPAFALEMLRNVFVGGCLFERPRIFTFSLASLLCSALCSS